MRSRWSILVAIGILAHAGALYWACLPPLAIEGTPYGVNVHVERLGEYSSRLTEFTIRDVATQSIVLQLVPEHGHIAMWALHVRDGNNQVGPTMAPGDYAFAVNIPRDGAPALFLVGHTYEVTIHGYSMVSEEFLPAPLWRTARFTL